MEIIKTIDLWTEQYVDQYECFNGAFVDGLSETSCPFDEYKIVKNCNCIITVDLDDIHIGNKHNAIIFYKEKKPVRLMVLNRNTSIEKCIDVALSQFFEKGTLQDYFKKFKIDYSVVDMQEEPIINKKGDFSSEIDVGSCDRWKLLYNMLRGSYTESDTSYGNFSSTKYEFIPNCTLKYELLTNSERFEIEHECAFINTIKTRLIPIQKNSDLTK